jgi:hypothetical protein
MSPVYLEYLVREDTREREEWGQKNRGTEHVRRGARPRLSRPAGGLRRNLARRLISLGLYVDPQAR